MILSGCGSPVQCWNSGVPVSEGRVDIIILLPISRLCIKDTSENLIFIRDVIFSHMYFIYSFGINKMNPCFIHNFMINKVCIFLFISFGNK